MKRLSDLTDYVSILPYSSEIFGVYQPLIGWKSKRIENRFAAGLSNDKQSVLQTLLRYFKPDTLLTFNPVDGSPCPDPDFQIKLGQLLDGSKNKTDSVLINTIAERLPPYAEYKDAIWDEHLADDNLNVYLVEFVRSHYQKTFSDLCQDLQQYGDRLKGLDQETLRSATAQQVNYESALAGALHLLYKNKQFDELKNIFYLIDNKQVQGLRLAKLLAATNAADAYLSLNNMNPRDQEHLRSVALSPIEPI